MVRIGAASAAAAVLRIGVEIRKQHERYVNSGKDAKSILSQLLHLHLPREIVTSLFE